MGISSAPISVNGGGSIGGVLDCRDGARYGAAVVGTWSSIVGPDFATAGAPRDAVDGVMPGWVVRPGSIVEVQAVVREGRPLVASGLGAHLDIGAPPGRLDVLLRLDRLDGVIDHQAADMTVTAAAGCSLATLDAVLAPAGQWLAVDPPAFDRTTVGGLIAANLCGPLRASQGAVRDLLLGIRVVNADARVVASGGKVVKNVAGYDLPKLHVGALGTVGVIVEATFKVRPRPEREEAAVLHAPTIDAAVALALATRDVLDPLWLDAGTLDRGAAAVVGIGGIDAEIVAARRAIEEVARRGGAGLEWTREGAALRARLGAFAVGTAATILRASVLPTDVGPVMRSMHELAREVPVWAQVASGVVRARVDDADDVRRCVPLLRSAIESRGGFLVVERAGPGVKQGLDVWGSPGEGLDLMRRVKEAFDPNGLFAAGRFVGGL